jgi:hypothetical protein
MVLAVMTVPTATFFVGGFSAMLLLSLALAVIVLEALVCNPYLADGRCAERAMASLRKQIIAAADAATDALTAPRIYQR